MNEPIYLVPLCQNQSKFRRTHFARLNHENMPWHTQLTLRPLESHSVKTLVRQRLKTATDSLSAVARQSQLFQYTECPTFKGLYCRRFFQRVKLRYFASIMYISKIQFFRKIVVLSKILAMVKYQSS